MEQIVDWKWPYNLIMESPYETLKLRKESLDKIFYRLEWSFIYNGLFVHGFLVHIVNLRVMRSIKFDYDTGVITDTTRLIA